MLNPYGFHYFDRPPEEDEDDDEYGESSCPDNCCDHDCECDDCVRCSDKALNEPDFDVDEPAVAA